MDISKASNFERFVFDLVGRDAARVKDLWRRLQAEGEFDLSHYGVLAARGAIGLRLRQEHRLRPPLPPSERVPKNTGDHRPAYRRRA